SESSLKNMNEGTSSTPSSSTFVSSLSFSLSTLIIVILSSGKFISSSILKNAGTCSLLSLHQVPITIVISTSFISSFNLSTAAESNSYISYSESNHHAKLESLNASRVV